MNDPQTDPLEDQLSLLAARADEEIAAGRPRTGVTTMIAPVELQPRLDKALACVELLRQFWNVEIPSRQAVDAAGPLPWKVLGRFEIRAELGRGGFGVVYLAYDPRLQREVALKVPRFDFAADPSLRRRFQHEAQAAAGLDHPNIVQIYETGEVGPVCFIASAYCPGVTLYTWMRARTEPVPIADSARLIATLADAVQHAHERGVLHRDLKPGNILLSSGDWRAADGEQIPPGRNTTCPENTPATRHPPLATPKITDFGLAKHIAAESAENSVEETHRGAILGTPQYMAPEQAEAKAVLIGPATDVYALGAILYELLTSRPPFQADSVLELLVQVKSVEPLAPGKLRPRLSRDLETICLKCLEKDPRRRYVSAAYLAADLRRYLAHEPILARPVSLPERCAKWTRRHPAIAGMAALTFGVALAGLSGILWYWQRAELAADNARTDRDVAVQERAIAERERAKSDENFRKATEVVDQLTQVGRDLATQPGMHQTAQSLLEKSLGFYQGFLAKKSTDPVIRLETARAYYRVAEIHKSLERHSEEETALAQGIALFDGLTTQFPQSDLYLSEKGKGLLEQGNGLRRQLKFPQAEPSFVESIRCWRELLVRAPSNTHYKASLATTLMNWCAVPNRSLAEKESGIAEAIRLEEEVTAATAPNNAGYRFQLAVAYDQLGLFLLDNGNKHRARQELERALAIHQELYDAKPRSVEYRLYLARSFSHLGRIQQESGERTQAIDSYRQAAKLVSSLVIEFPDFPTYRRDLASHLNLAAGLLDQPAERSEREALYRQIIDHYARLMQQVPSDPYYTFGHGTHLVLLGRNLHLAGRNAESEKYFLAGVESRLKLATEVPENQQYQGSAARDTAEVSQRYLEQHRYKDAEAILRRCVKCLPGNAEACNTLAWFLVTCPENAYLNPAAAIPLAKSASTARPANANIWNTLGVVYYRNGDYRQSIHALETAINLRKDGTPFDWLFLAMARWQLEEKSQANELYDRSVEWMTKKKSTDAELIRFRAEAANLIGRK